MGDVTGLVMIMRDEGSGGVLRVSPGFTDQTGLTSAELDSLPLEEWIHPDDRPRLHEIVHTGAGRYWHSQKQSVDQV